MRNCGFPPSSSPLSIYLSRDSALEQQSGFVGLKIQPQPTPLFLKTGGICQVFPFSILPPSLVFQEGKEKGKAEQGKKPFFFPDPPSTYTLYYAHPLVCRKKERADNEKCSSVPPLCMELCFCAPPLLPPLEFFPPPSSPCVQTHTHLENNEKNSLCVSQFSHKKADFFIPPIKILIEHTLYTVVVTPMRLRAGLTYRCQGGEEGRGNTL